MLLTTFRQSTKQGGSDHTNVLRDVSYTRVGAASLGHIEHDLEA